VRVWAFSKVQDIHGNYYTIQYEQDSGDYYPARIVYTQRDGSSISKYRVIDFVYDTSRNDYCVQYTYSSAVTTRWRLQEIDIYVDVWSILGYLFTVTGTEVKEYKLGYTEETNGYDSSRLNTVGEYGNNGSSIISSLTFTWDDTELGFNPPILHSTPPYGSNGFIPQCDETAYVGDFNGYGKDGLYV
jgi:hypothetical protein